MKRANFPGRKRARQQTALSHLTLNSNLTGIDVESHERVLQERKDTFNQQKEILLKATSDKYLTKTKKDRHERARISI